MKKYVYLVITLGLMASVQQAMAADPQATTDASMQSSPASEAAPSTVSEPAVSAPEAAAPEVAPVDAVPAGVPAAAPEPAAAVPNNENLEFVSGEVTAVDEAQKTVSVKLYGETEQSTPEKVVTIKVDEATDITDGEKDRDLKSLTPGTEVDVEYDAGSSKATYIFVY